MKFKQVPIQLSFGSEHAFSALDSGALQSGEIMGHEKDDMPAALANSLKADEEDRRR